ncbi:hypothetical protein [Aggregatibacter actinomycetemcomitans]|uniref:hypothetical protein n=1 Tax=Aggregatibacter actinomycetemcomitans TaxID=714 RepID=UPI00197B84C4|nr:hypothetical protein [Aggregatibacter actinomycetemcomitans]MBN6064738.1 hypothetical protein [Aggregatibacter actinomycetemcomitans]MBN6081874.1 hypothetical protein [Aggregatibacter actinomycetemcomitans]MBN6084164.1 hypothetical protein [Aggregatibacter actinomycetemcomitans]
MEQQNNMTLPQFIEWLNNIEARLAILEEKQGRATNPEEIWNTHDIANYAKCSYAYVIQELVHLPDFPENLGTPKPRAPKKYRAGDIIRYFTNRNRRTRTTQ